MKTKDTNTHAALALRLALSAGLCTGLSAGTAVAAPSGGEVESGTADIVVDGVTTTITTGHTTILSWDSFDIGSGERVDFLMPGASSRVLNRINSVTPTTINGTLSANGRVYLVNSSGIVFGADSVVNVGALYAAAGNISDTDFINGTDRFTDLQGTVENRGSITSGDMVSMVGARVTNIGSISAPEGTVVMAAGEEVVIGDLLGHTFVTIEKPVADDPAPLAGGSDLAAGDMYSIAAFHSGSIDAKQAVVKAKGGDTVIAGSVRATGDAGVELAGDNLVFMDDGASTRRGGAPITGPSVTLSAAPGGVIDLGVDVLATVDDINLFGDVRLTDSVSLTASGFQAMIIAHGDIYSQAGAFHNLTVSTPTGFAEFRGALGEDTPSGAGLGGSLGGPGVPGTIGPIVGSTDGAFTTFEVESGGPMTGDLRLGFYEVNAPLSLYEKNVSVRDGMNIFSEAGITGERVVFHTGTGDALFAQDIYSTVRGASDIAFMYDDAVDSGVGAQRVPFSFRGNIGTPPVTRLIPTSGAFRTIEMGADADSFLTSASFFFSTGAQGGGALSDLATTDTSEQFFITATESVLVGRGQKVTALGAIQFAARGEGATRVEVSDVNAVGDITLFSRSRIGDNTITLLRHEGGLIDGVENEPDRAGGGLEELGGELIAGGDITFFGDLAADTDGIAMGHEAFVLANTTGSGSALGLTIDAVGFNPATALEFLGTQPASVGGLYAYDLTLGDFIGGPSTPGSLANLAESLPDENTLSIRDDEPYLAQREVLRELGLNPVDPALQTRIEAAADGRGVYLDSQTAPQALTIDRLSKLSVERFVGLYIDLLGERDPITGRRAGLDEIHDALTGTPEERERVLGQIRTLMERLDMLELTPLELERARANLYLILVPEGMDAALITAMR